MTDHVIIPPALARLGARPTTLHEIETTPRKEPPFSFYVVNTHFETALPIDEVVHRIDNLFRGDTFLYRQPVINYTGFNWIMKQENVGEDEEWESYCTTAINVLKKKHEPGVFIVEGVRLNGNPLVFQKNWSEFKNVFGVDL